MLEKNLKKLFSLLLVLMVAGSILFLATDGAYAADTTAQLVVNVKDRTGINVADAMVYIIENPQDKSSCILDETKIAKGQAVAFSLKIGTYSVGAYHPDYGWAVHRINVTTNDLTKTATIRLNLKPVAENWTDLNGVTHEKLTSWPFKDEASLKPASTITDIAASPASGMWILIDEQSFNQYYTTIGEAYSAPGLTVYLALKFVSGIQTKASFDGGALTLSGTTSSSSTSTVNLPAISNGESRTIKNYYDYVYQWWRWTPGGGDMETWSQSAIYAGSAVYSTPYPTDQFRSLSETGDIFDATDTPAYQTKTITRQYGQYSDAGWSISSAITLAGSWTVYSGSVNLGGSFGFTGYSYNDAVYTYNLQGGRIILVDEWNTAGTNAAGTMLAYRNKFWSTSIQSYGWISGSGNAYNPTNLIGQNEGSYAQIIAPNLYDAGYINAYLNADTSGHIYVYGNSATGYNGCHLYTYVSSDNQNWNLAGVATVNYQGSFQYIDCGSYAGSFRYISFTGYNDNSQPINIYIDAVHVVP